MRLNIILNFSYLVILIIILFGSEIQPSLGNYKAKWISRTLTRSETKKIPKKITGSENNKIPKLSTRSENNKIPKSQKEVKSQVFSSFPKGQLISKCLFGVFKSPKKTRNFFQDFCPSL